MGRKRKSATANENWIKTSDLNSIKDNADRVLAKVKNERSIYREVFVPHPTQPRAVICRLIKK